MENLTLIELKTLSSWFWLIDRNAWASRSDNELHNKIKQAIADKEFEEKSKPLNF